MFFDNYSPDALPRKTYSAGDSELGFARLNSSGSKTAPGKVCFDQNWPRILRRCLGQCRVWAA